MSVLHGSAQDPAILRKVSLGECGHHAAAAGAGNAQAHVVADRERAADPGLFGKLRLPVHGVDDDVRTKARDFEAPLRVEAAEPAERGGRQEMNGRTVEECARRQREFGDGISVVEALEIGPVLFGLRRPG
jgi:hypothetical protein